MSSTAKIASVFLILLALAYARAHKASEPASLIKEAPASSILP